MTKGNQELGNQTPPQGDWYYTSAYASRMGTRIADFERSMMRKLLGNAGSRLTILDVGGGDGQHTLFVKHLGHAPVLLEYDPKPIDLFLQRGTDIPAIHASGMALPIRDGTFDVVMTIEVSICLTGKDDNNSRHFADVHRILKKGGLFIATTHNRDSYISLLKRLDRNRPAYESLYYREGLKEYKQKLRNAGFDIEGCWGYRWLPFRRDSNNPLIPFLGFLEKALFLKNVARFGPWLFLAARKR